MKKQPTIALLIETSRSYGRELWKHLALGVLFLLIFEIALARWVATKRKTGNQEVIDAIKRQADKIAYAHTAFFTSDAAEALFTKGVFCKKLT